MLPGSSRSSQEFPGKLIPQICILYGVSCEMSNVHSWASLLLKVTSVKSLGETKYLEFGQCGRKMSRSRKKSISALQHMRIA